MDFVGPIVRGRPLNQQSVKPTANRQSQNRKSQNALTDPASGNAGLAGFFLNVRNGLRVLRDLFADAIELGERLLPIAADLVALVWIVASSKISGQRVDPALQRFGEELRTAERVALGTDALAPGFLVLLGIVGGVGVRLGRGGSDILGSRWRRRGRRRRRRRRFDLQSVAV